MAVSAGVVINLMVSIAGTVTSIGTMTMPWEEVIHVIERQP